MNRLHLRDMERGMDLAAGRKLETHHSGTD